MKRSLMCIFIHLLFCSANIVTLNYQATQRIGKKIWHNEASGRMDYLTFWSEKESFPSLGIGHNIWLHQDHETRYSQGFPALCQYLKRHKITLPAWLEKSLRTGAPWKSREEFYADQDKLNDLRKLLSSTISLQTQFMIDRLHHKLHEIIKAAPTKQRHNVKKNIDLLLSTEQGTYILVDYLNFKGDGLSKAETSNGESWGLLSVLLDMPDHVHADNVAHAFTVCAAKKLLMLIEHSQPEYKRLHFFGGWMARLNTYTK